MRNIVTILLFLLVLAQTPLGEVMKFPMLIEHFSNHKKMNGVSFLEFLYDHYFKEHIDADTEDDNRLPFKTALLQNTGVAILPSTEMLQITITPVDSVKFILQDFFVPIQHLTSIFHPPRAW